MQIRYKNKGAGTEKQICFAGINNLNFTLSSVQFIVFFCRLFQLLFSFNLILLKQDRRIFQVIWPISKYVCIPESFNTNISHQFYDNKIAFVNSRIQMGIQKPVLNDCFKDFWYTRIHSESKISTVGGFKSDR